MSIRVAKIFTVFGDAVKRIKTECSNVDENEIDLMKAGRRMVYFMRTTTSKFDRRWYEQRAKEEMKVLDEIMGTMDSNPMKNGSHIKPTG